MSNFLENKHLARILTATICGLVAWVIIMVLITGGVM